MNIHSYIPLVGMVTGRTQLKLCYPLTLLRIKLRLCFSVYLHSKSEYSNFALTRTLGPLIDFGLLSNFILSDIILMIYTHKKLRVFFQILLNK